ncbi:MAG: SDR family NAD(P)-dependent oxidoreductase [Rubellimicrobium sp.]|nr:SDR family NAD(P)-dependent oxidoreductase [Rubellimicrobium sp.]
MRADTTGPLAGRHLAILGLGYTAQEVARQAMAQGARVSGTTGDAAKAARLVADGVTILATQDGELYPDALADVTDLLVSIPPTPAGCPGVPMIAPELPGARSLRWIGYLSSSAIYGDCGGDWIDETREPAPRSRHALARLDAEQDWREIARFRSTALDILRIAGIYGPGRDRIASLRDGTARVIDKSGQVFNRIHRDDIAGAVLAAMMSPAGTRVTNLADGAPCSPVELMRGVAGMLGLEPPAVVPWDPATLPPGMARFYAESRRLKNDRLRALPGFVLRYPDWRAGYRAIIAAAAA